MGAEGKLELRGTQRDDEMVHTIKLKMVHAIKLKMVHAIKWYTRLARDFY